MADAAARLRRDSLVVLTSQHLGERLSPSRAAELIALHGRVDDAYAAVAEEVELRRKRTRPSGQSQVAGAQSWMNGAMVSRARDVPLPLHRVAMVVTGAGAIALVLSMLDWMDGAGTMSVVAPALSGWIAVCYALRLILGRIGDGDPRMDVAFDVLAVTGIATAHLLSAIAAWSAIDGWISGAAHATLSLAVLGLIAWKSRA